MMVRMALRAFRIHWPAVVSAAAAVALLASCGGSPAPRESTPPPVTPAPQAVRVYVSDETGGTVVVIDPLAARVVERIPVGKRPRGIRLSPDGKQLYVALSGSPIAPPGVDESTLPPPDRAADGIGAIDLASSKLVKTYESGQDPE